MEEIALLNTTLIKWDGSRVLYPNYKMNTDMITNITRSNNKGEVFSVNVDFSTSLEVFAQIEALIKIHSDASPDINAIAVSPGNGGNPLKFTMNIWWEYTFNSKFPCCVRDSLKAWLHALLAYLHGVAVVQSAYCKCTICLPLFV